MPQAINILRTNYLPQRRNFLYVTKKTTIPGPVTNQIAINFAAIDFNPDSGWQNQEFISLTNSTAVAVDLSGWKLTGGVTHRFAAGTVLPVKGSIYLSPDVNAFRKRSSGPKGGQRLFIQGNYQGQLSARGETLTLRDNQDQVVQTFTYPGQPTQAQQSLRISEIMYAPPDPNQPGLSSDDLEYVTPIR